MKGGNSDLKHTNYFLEKLRELGKVSPHATIVRVDVADLYPSIQQDAGLKTLH